MVIPIFIPLSHAVHHYHSEDSGPKYRYKERRKTSTLFKEAIFVFKLKDSVKPKTWWQKFWWVPKAEIIRLGTEHITKYEIAKIHDDASAKEYAKTEHFFRYINGDYSLVSSLFDFAKDSMVQDVLENYEFVEVKDLGFRTDWVKVNPNEREVVE